MTTEEQDAPTERRPVRHNLNRAERRRMRHYVAVPEEDQNIRPRWTHLQPARTGGARARKAWKRQKRASHHGGRR